MTALLNPTQSALVSDERAALLRLLDVLDAWEASPDETHHLRDALSALDELFLLVVTGEFNAGKSALINTLLGHRFLEEGVTPTTRQILVLTHGQSAPPRPTNDHWTRSLPAPLLREMHIVDTPGTNAIVRQHETITREFIPRADLVLFVTSADRPFTASERTFLEMISSWGKKIVFVVNKVDLLELPQDREEVVAYVRQGARELLGEPPTLFALSARAALAALDSADREGLAASGWPPFAEWLQKTLTAEERLRLKLENPVGVAERVAAEARSKAQTQLAVLDDDRAALDEVEMQLQGHRADIRREFAGRLDGIEKNLMVVRERGEAFLDTHYRLKHIRELLDSDRLRSRFEAEVIADTPDVIEAEVSALIDWIIDREHAQWQLVRDRLAERTASKALLVEAPSGAAGFASRRRALLETIGRESDAVVASFDPAAESSRLALEVQDTLARTALVEVGALGLGLVLKAVLASTAADATGLLAAGVLAVFGLTLLPHRRRQTATALRERVGTVREELRTTLSAAFAREMDNSTERMTASVAPYLRFLLAEMEQLEALVGNIDALTEEFADLRVQIVAAARPHSG